MTSITYSGWISRCFDGDSCLIDEFEYREYVTIEEATDYVKKNGDYDEY